MNFTAVLTALWLLFIFGFNLMPATKQLCFCMTLVETDNATSTEDFFWGLRGRQFENV
jgi:hypothetical protein